MHLLEDNGAATVLGDGGPRAELHAANLKQFVAHCDVIGRFMV